jgi:hypothetical protein
MSLQLLAKQMEAKGRGGDSVLVHMTTGEVAGLQKLAESAGGSLSVNPDTGLVEANFLKQMLPTLVGAGVGFFTANPYLGAAAGAAVGGYQANRAGRDVGEGMVMGGLGGYGGATFGSSLQAAGAPAAGTGAAAKPATDMATRAVMQQALGGGQNQAITAAQQQAALAEGAILSPLDRISQAAGPIPATAFGTGATAPVAVIPPTAQPTAQVNPPPKSFSDMSFSERASQGLRGLEALGTKEGRDTAYKDLGGSESIMRSLMFAGLPYMSQAPTSRRSPYPLLSADLNKRGFAEGGSIDDAVANRKYIIDPATGDVVLNPNIRRPATTFADIRGSDGGIGGVAPNPNFDTPKQRADYYAENPTMGAITRAGQTALRYAPVVGSLLAAQNLMDPGLQQEARAETYGTVIDIGDPIGRSDIQGVALGDLAPGGGESGGGRGVDHSRPGPDSNYGGEGEAAGGLISLASGGLMGLAKGGMKSGGFVIPADVVSMVGEGNTDAGYKRIKSMVPGATAIKGKDGGQADTVKTSIEGKQPARVAHGEMYIPPETVKRMGGAKKLYAMMDRVREQATGSKKQIKPVSLKRAMA